jgi:transcriptional regulator with XRE-family HTH domain
MTLLRLGAMLRDRRGGRGIREVAQEIGISPATVTRVEGGRLPDIATFQKICAWLQVNPAEILDIPMNSPTSTDTLTVAFHPRADQTLPETAAADLAQLIMVAHHELARRTQKRRVDVSAWL